MRNAQQTAQIQDLTTAFDLSCGPSAVDRALQLPVPLLLPAADGETSSALRRPGDVLRGLLASTSVAFLSPIEYVRRLRACAAKLRQPAYSLRSFHADLQQLFPELRLYLCAKQGPSTTFITTSGNTPKDEYKRTLGALFALYWLCRLELPEVCVAD